MDTKNVDWWSEADQSRVLCATFEEVWTGRGRLRGEDRYRGRNLDKFIHTWDQGQVNDVEDPRLTISKEIQARPVREEADVCGLLWHEGCDSGTRRTTWTDGQRSVLHEGKLYCLLINNSHTENKISYTDSITVLTRCLHILLNIQVLKRDFLRAMRKKRAEYLPSIIFHHDNAPSHRAASTKTAIQQLGFEVLDHPPYSPDLSPCDFFLFPVMKSYLRGTHFDDFRELSTAVKVAIQNIQPDAFRKCFAESWVERCRKCISFRGEYFEKDWLIPLKRFSPGDKLTLTSIIGWAVIPSVTLL